MRATRAIRGGGDGDGHGGIDETVASSPHVDAGADDAGITRSGARWRRVERAERGVQPGDVIAERFQIERVAGSGGMGIVYLAHDLRTRGPVALKILLGRKESE